MPPGAQQNDDTLHFYYQNLSMFLQLAAAVAEGGPLRLTASLKGHRICSSDEWEINLYTCILQA